MKCHSNRTRTIHAPCKVNLTLDVFAPRPDSFHDLDSIVVKFKPTDVLTLTEIQEPAVRMTCSDPLLPTDEQNLACRAALLFYNRVGRKLDLPYHLPGLHIDLHKRLPYQAGLGSGSSDAACVLATFSEWYSITRESEEELGKIAIELGSDVPLFLHSGAVRMRGRGEVIESINTAIPILHGVIVKPSTGVSTPYAYRQLDAIPGRLPGNATQNLLSVLQSFPNDLRAVASALGNDFEAAVLSAFPQVGDAHRAVTEAGSLRTLLCGSGAAVFGLAESADHAEEMARDLRATKRFAWVEVAESLP